MKRTVVTRLFYVLMAIMLMASFVPTSGAVKAQSEIPPIDISKLESVDLDLTVENVLSDLDLSKAGHEADGRVRVIVMLKDPAVAAYTGRIEGMAATSPKATGAVKLDMSSPASQTYQSYLKDVQANFASNLVVEAPSAEVRQSYQVAFNGVALAIDETEVEALAKMQEVAAIYPDEIRTADLDASLDLINVPEVWDMVGGEANGGAGIKIAVVDSGITPENPMFDDTGFTAPAGYPKGYCLTDPTFCNDKLIVARYFYDPLMDSDIAVEEFKTEPRDVSGHGTHTASTAAGVRTIVPASDIGPTGISVAGVAPGAYVMAYKALFEVADHSTASGYDSMLGAAMEAALSDGADIISNSWGGGAGGAPEASVYKTIIENINAAGTLVVFSAGNSGPNYNTIGCPGCVEDALTVAASTTERSFVNYVDVTGPGTIDPSLTGLWAVNGSGPVIAANYEGPIKYDAANLLGCNAYSANYFADETDPLVRKYVALIARGTCGFAAKVANAQAAGAKAVIVYNSSAAAPIVMGLLDGSTIPSVMIYQADGLAIKAWLDANPTATVRINQTEEYFDPMNADIMASFSSVGPNGNPSFLKPDITAPGVDILAGFSPVLGGKNFTAISGTSMACPHVAGAAALVMQLHPDWSTMQVKTALTTTSVQGLANSTYTDWANPFQMGAGRMDVYRAVNAGLTFSKPSFTNPSILLSTTFTATMKNVTDSTVTWEAILNADENFTAEISPATITLAPGQSADFEISIDMKDAPANTYFFGGLQWVDEAGNYPEAYLPIVVRRITTTNSTMLTVSAAATAQAQATIPYTVSLANTTTSAAKYTVVNHLAEGVEYDGLAPAWTYDAAARTLTQSLDMTGAELSFSEFPGATYQDLTGFTPDLTMNAYCTSGCDDEAWNLNGMNFTYMGQTVTRIGIATNGFAQVGGATSTTANNQLLPNATVPNGILAPFWADFDLYTSGTDTGAGTLNVFGLSDGTNTYTVFEWRNVQVYGKSGTAFNFQLWIMDGSPYIWYSYGALTGLDTTINATVGAEDNTGVLGQTLYYCKDGATAGTAPVLNQEFDIVSNLDRATLTFNGKIVGPTYTTTNAVIDYVEVFNNIDATTVSATAKTTVIPFTYFFGEVH